MKQLLHGDCREILKTLSDNSVDCVVTSPPYYGLRKYALSNTIWDAVNGCKHEEWGSEIIRRDRGTTKGQTAQVGNQINEVSGIETPQGQFCQSCGAWRGQLGLEPTPELYIKHLVGIFQEVKRVLKPSGVCFVNLGDSYSGSNNGSNDYREKDGLGNAPTLRYQGQQPGKTLKPKDLCLIPFRFAIAMQEDGWWVRSTIIWSKNNPMPESVRDRPTDSHEYIFMLTKSASYYWNQEAVREPIAETTLNRINLMDNRADPFENALTGEFGNQPEYVLGHRYKEGQGKVKGSGQNVDHLVCRPSVNGRNLRSVWTFPTHGYSGAHFATFPEKLPELCIKAGCPEQVCKTCGQPWVNVVEQKPTCSCDAETEPGIVMDIFGGSGTVGAVAIKLARQYIIIEQSEEYIKLCKDRLKQGSLL